ncbi:MAG: hypothetical protein MUE41_08640 [Gemmatimonadaceae bacterium]|nr:hypothetical protein [Gemmatimonadaceae bacterium]
MALVAQGGTTGTAAATRLRSSVLLRPPVTETLATPPRTRPASALPAAAAVTRVRSNESAGLMTAARRVRDRVDASPPSAIVQPGPPRPAGQGAMPLTVQDAATQLARELYGTKAARVAVRDARMATVFLDDTLRKEAAPPGLGVGEGVSLPVRFVAVDSASGDLMALKPWFDDGGGLRYDSRSASYVATLRLGVRDSLRSARARLLTPPVRFSIVAAADSIEPARVEIGETNVFVSSARLVSTRRAAAVQVELWPDFAEQSLTVWVPFRRDTVLVAVDRPTADGLGLDALRVTVAVPPGAIAPDDSIAVMLQASRGTLDEQTLYPTGARPASTRLRSAGVGRVQITARSAALDDGLTTARFTAPLGLVAGSVIGALVGSLLLLLRERTASRRRHRGALIASGVLSGMIIALVIAIGVLKLPGLELPSGSGTLVALLAGVIGGYVGPKGLETLIPALSAGRTNAPTG